MSTYQRLINTILCSFLAIVAVFSFVACGSDESVSTYELAAMETKPVVTTKENDTRFLVRAVELRYEQILINKLAQQRTSNEEIRAIAASLEQANRDAKSALASLAIMKSIKVPGVPTASAQAAYDSLNVFTVEEFDLAYITAAMKGYDDAIAQFESAGRETLDAEIQAKVAAMLPELRTQKAKVAQFDITMNAISAVTD